MLPSGDGKKRHTPTPLAWRLVVGASILFGVYLLWGARSAALAAAEEMASLRASFAEASSELHQVLKFQKEFNELFLQSQQGTKAADVAVKEMKTEMTSALSRLEGELKAASSVPEHLVARCQQQTTGTVDHAVSLAVNDAVQRATKQTYEQLEALQSTLQASLAKQLEQQATQEREADGRSLERWGQVQKAMAALGASRAAAASGSDAPTANSSEAALAALLGDHQAGRSAAVAGAEAMKPVDAIKPTVEGIETVDYLDGVPGSAVATSVETGQRSMHAPATIHLATTGTGTSAGTGEGLVGEAHDTVTAGAIDKADAAAEATEMAAAAAAEAEVAQAAETAEVAQAASTRAAHAAHASDEV